MSSETAKMSPKAQAVDEALVLARTNALLARLGFGDRSFSRAADLVASVSSMSVALYEKLFQFRLPDVFRVPRTLQDYEHNAQLVVDALSGAMLEPEDLGASRSSNSAMGKRLLSGKILCGGEWRAILQLVEMLEGVYEILYDDDGVFRGGKLPVSNRNNVHKQAWEGKSSLLQGQKTAKVTTTRTAKAKSDRAGRISKEKSRRGYEGDKSSDSEPGSNPLPRRSHRATERRISKSSRLNASMSRIDPKQAEIRDGGIVQESAGSDKAGSPSSSSSSSASPTEHRLARSLVTANPRHAVEKLSRSTSSVRSIKSKISASERRSSKHLRSSTHQDKIVTNTIASTRSARLSPKTDEQSDLLQTQKYGRFVGSTKSTHPPAREITKKREEKNLSFGNVSSVSIASEVSRHFLDEGTDLANTFSALSVSSPRSVHSSEKAQFDMDDSPKPDLRSSRHRAINPNQQEAAEVDDLNELGDGNTDVENENIHENGEDQSPGNPSAKKGKGLDGENEQGSKRQTGNSKAQAEYLRYKLTLKNHLQDLRKREFCQRKHMERAYRAGEHTANVDKIRARRFAQDIRLQRIAIGLETKEEEEKQLRHAMHHLLDLEKEKLREEHRVTTTVLKQIQKDHRDREEAIETFYANQIRLVREKTSREAKERELMEKAHRQVSEQMAREMRRERESQLLALLQEKQQLEEARRFRQATHMAQLLERTDQHAVERTDAFYTAATRTRQLRKQSRSSPQLTRRHRETESVYSKAKLKTTPSASKTWSATQRYSTRVY